MFRKPNRDYIDAQLIGICLFNIVLLYYLFFLGTFDS
jgi:hypothetical protein